MSSTSLVQRWAMSHTEMMSLSVLNFTGRIKVIDRTDEGWGETQIRDLLGIGSEKIVVGFDTEAKPKAMYSSTRNPTALVQLASENACILWRTVGRIDLPDALCNILNDPNIVKVGQGLGLDLEDMRKDFSNVPPQIPGLVDLHKIASKLNCQPKSLQGLVGIFLRKRLLKDMRLSNWEEDVLRAEQIQYAAIDAWAARSVYLQMQARGISVDELGALSDQGPRKAVAVDSRPQEPIPQEAESRAKSAQVQLVNLCVRKGYLLRLSGFEKSRNSNDKFKCIFEIIQPEKTIRVESAEGHSSIRAAQEDASSVALGLLGN